MTDTLTIRHAPPDAYTAAVGTVRALERFLFTRAVFEEAIGAGLEDALKLFASSSAYGERVLRVRTGGDLEAVLDEEAARARALAGKLLIDGELLRLITTDDLAVMRGLADGYGNRFIGDYIRHVIDMEAVRTFLRCSVTREPPERFAACLTAEGFIPKKELAAMYGQEVSALIHRLEFVHKRFTIVDYAGYLRDGVLAAAEERSFVLLERGIYDLLFDFLKEAKYISFGPEPVVAYYYARLNEIRLMRMIILAKMRSARPEVVRMRMNSVYA